MKSFKFKNTYIVIGLVTVALVMGILAFIQVNQYGKNINLQKQFVSQMIGACEEGVDGEKIASSILKGEVNKSQVEKGNQFLEVYGYTKNYETIYDNYLKDYRINIAFIYTIIYLLIIAVIFETICIRRKKEKEELEEIYNILYNFHKGEYSVNLTILSDNIRSKINNQLESLGKRLSLNEVRLKEEKEETKSLVTDISHQLKTPLASLKMCFSLLNEENLEPIERKEFMERSIEQLNNLEALTASLVNISRMETGMIKIEKQNKRILDTIISSINTVYLKAEEKNIQVELEDINEETENLTLLHDEKWTREAIANVLENAVKYSEKESKIRIRLHKLTTFLRIEIEDEGIGIDKKEYTEIFKRFYRGKSDLVKNEEGSGVGLYLTRKILEEQGGNITVTSKKSIGEKGSRFVIQLSLI